MVKSKARNSTQQGCRTVSQRYLRAAIIPERARVWVPHDQEVWAPAEVVSQDNTIVVAKLMHGNAIVQIDLVCLAYYIPSDI